MRYIIIYSLRLYAHRTHFVYSALADAPAINLPLSPSLACMAYALLFRIRKFDFVIRCDIWTWKHINRNGRIETENNRHYPSSSLSYDKHTSASVFWRRKVRLRIELNETVACAARVSATREMERKNRTEHQTVRVYLFHFISWMGRRRRWRLKFELRVSCVCDLVIYYRHSAWDFAILFLRILLQFVIGISV